jgi:predicted ATPase
VLALVEDADWSDPTTRELLDLVVDRMPSLPLLLLVTSAKDLGSSWHRRPHVTSLALSRLNRDDSGTVIHKQTGEGMIADEVIAKIIGRREELHARVAAALEQRFPEVAGRHPELVARHLSVAGATGRAIGYWFRAGERTKRRAADHEAIACYRAAQRLAEELPDPFERAAWERRISIALGPVLMKTTSSAAPEVARVYARARRLAEESGRSVRLCSRRCGPHGWRAFRPAICARPAA